MTIWQVLLLIVSIPVAIMGWRITIRYCREKRFFLSLYWVALETFFTLIMLFHWYKFIKELIQ